MAENLVSSLWVEVSYLTSVYVDVEGWVSMIRNYEQQWACISKSHGGRTEPACICSSWSSVECLRVLLCWRVRHDGGLDTWTKRSARELVSRFIWWLETLIEHTSWDRLALYPVLMVQASNSGTFWAIDATRNCDFYFFHVHNSPPSKNETITWWGVLRLVGKHVKSISWPSQSAQLLLDFQATENRCSRWLLVNTNVNVNVNVSHAL